MDKKQILLLCGVVLTAAYASSSMAAPLANGTKLTIAAGSGSGFGVPCPVGSCFGMELAKNQYFWTDIIPGTDGALIVGTDQGSGGQELGLSASNSTAGALTAAWSFGGSYGTFATAPGGGASNIFDDANCANASCLGKTELKVWNVAWNGNLIPMGSAAPCTHINCSADQKNGIFITDWKINPVRGGAWSIAKNAVVPGYVPGFGGFGYQVILRGTVPLPAAAWLFGSGLIGLAAVARRKKSKV